MYKGPHLLLNQGPMLSCYATATVHIALYILLTVNMGTDSNKDWRSASIEIPLVQYYV